MRTRSELEKHLELLKECNPADLHLPMAVIKASFRPHKPRRGRPCTGLSFDTCVSIDVVGTMVREWLKQEDCTAFAVELIRTQDDAIAYLERLIKGMEK